MTLYEILQVREDATLDEIRSAYRKLALQWHPDRNKHPDAARVMAILNQAHEILSDHEKRKLYDAKLAAARQPAMMQVRVIVTGFDMSANSTSCTTGTSAGWTFFNHW